MPTFLKNTLNYSKARVESSDRRFISHRCHQFVVPSEPVPVERWEGICVAELFK
jgi:hypothetical protein